MTLDDFVTQRSKQFLSRLQIDDSFLREDDSWGDNPTFLEARRRISRLKVVNDTAERAVKLMQDFNGLGRVAYIVPMPKSYFLQFSLTINTKRHLAIYIDSKCGVFST